MSGADGVEGSRRRHPSVRAPVAAAALATRVAGALAGGGARWPEVAAAVLADRGTTGWSAAHYARSLGIDAATLARAEAGALGPGDLPPALLRVVVARRWGAA
ncbi:MAG TPA: hypothetical protein VFV42_07135 [Acidimicrobiales bacterium]|nr:hypothetical protein [Acidimicrobiales bacterium]